MRKIVSGERLYSTGSSAQCPAGGLERWEGLGVGRKVQEGGDVYICVYIHTGEGNGNPLQYSCLENPMDRGAWRATVHRVAESRTQLKRLSIYTHTY